SARLLQQRNYLCHEPLGQDTSSQCLRPDLKLRRPKQLSGGRQNNVAGLLADWEAFEKYTLRE
ncbi:MAG TPA: hypothetical protein VES69_14930, partial [Pyrinomonadaceae bacterium]|nr:hypothetical protein [Pyrinomonadaceae bacterium]